MAPIGFERMSSDEEILVMQDAGLNFDPSARRVAGRALDLSLASLAPSLPVIDAFLLMRLDHAAADLEAMVAALVLVPWVAFLPVVVWIWLRHVGMPTPGRYLRGERRRPRSGPLWVDTVLVTAAVFASLPMFYASQILPDEARGAFALLVVPAPMLVGSLFSVLAPASTSSSRM